MKLYKMILVLAGAAAAAACSRKAAEEPAFKYVVDSFADLKVMRYQVPGWDALTLRQKEYVYHLSEAAKLGRDITWDQYCRYNLPIRHAIEDILVNYEGDRGCEDWKQFEIYAKRVFFANGIHHHYAEDKFFPGCPRDYFAGLLQAVSGEGDSEVAGETRWTGAEGLSMNKDELLEVIYNPDIYPQRRSTDRTRDIVASSAVNFYGEGVTREEVDAFYARQAVPGAKEPVAYGLNSKVVKENGRLVEKKWMEGIMSIHSEEEKEKEQVVTSFDDQNNHSESSEDTFLPLQSRPEATTSAAEEPSIRAYPQPTSSPESQVNISDALSDSNAHRDPPLPTESHPPSPALEESSLAHTPSLSYSSDIDIPQRPSESAQPPAPPPETNNAPLTGIRGFFSRLFG